MSTPATQPPRAHLLKDPRLPDLLAKALNKFNMEDYFDMAVLKLVSGETDRRTVICCDTGCHPCAKDYLGAADYILKGLAKGEGKRKRFWFF